MLKDATSFLEAMTKRRSFEIVSSFFKLTVWWNSHEYESIKILQHHHSFFEFHYCLTGNSTFYLAKPDEESIEIKLVPNTFILIASNIAHSSVATRDFSKWVLGFDIEVIDNENGGWIKSAFESFEPYQNYSGNDQMLNSIERIETLSHTHGIGSMALLANSVEALLINMAICIIPEGIVESNYSKNDVKEVGRYTVILQFIKDNIGRSIDAQTVADYFYLSTRQLDRLLISNYGISTSKLIQTLRLQLAQQLLAKSDLSLSEIAEQVGFSNQYSFSRFFSNNAGLSPVEFRKSVK